MTYINLFQKTFCFKVFKVMLSVSIASATFLIPVRAYAAAVEVHVLPKEAIDAVEVIGRDLASKADQQLKAEVATYARENLFGISGDLIPSGEVTFGRAGTCAVYGRNGVVLEFIVHARAKVDVGTRKLGFNAVRKVWAVDTKQVIQLVLLPKQKDDGTIVAEVRAEIVSASADKERQAKQRDADGFRDRVSGALREKLSGFTGGYDIKGVLEHNK